MHSHVSTPRTSVSKGLVALVIATVSLLAVMIASTLPQTAQADETTQPVYRLYNNSNGKHHYTVDENEKTNLLGLGWRNEGIGWVSPKHSDTPIYRLYNEWSGEHFYTADKGEHDRLAALGWSDEGVKLYSAGKDGMPAYRLYNPYAGEGDPSSHHYTVSETEKNSLLSQGWRDEAIGWYVVSGPVPVEPNLLLGSFFVDTPGQGAGFETVLAYSRDGYDFTMVSVPYSPSENPFHDPSIMYKDGYFYMLSNWNRQNGKFNPMISYSRDLVTWTEPEGGTLINGGNYDGIPLESLPFGIADFDVVAPEWFKDDNGDVYILFSAGFYGENHGQPEQDRMKPYAVKVDISHNGISQWTGGLGNKNLPQDLTLKFDKAFEIQGLQPSDNYIDSSMYKVGGKYYLLTKKDGVNNQIYAADWMAPWGWNIVNDSIAWGNEGPSLTNVDGAYMLYTDMIQTSHGRTGIQVCTSTAPWNSFTGAQDVTCHDRWGNRMTFRHGTVLNLQGDAKLVGETFLRSNGL